MDGSIILKLLNAAFDFWNSQTEIVLSILTTNPESVNGGKVWSIIETVNPIFVGVGMGLITLFFVIGLCSESIDVREDVRIETVLKSLIKISIAGWLVAYNLDIVKAVFQVVANFIVALMSKIGGGVDIGKISISDGAAATIEHLSLAESFLFMILAAVIALVVIVCSFGMIYAVYFRFLRIFTLVPFGSLTFSTFAGNRNINIASSYFKYFLSVAMEALVMVIAIMVCNAFVNGGLLNATEPGDGDWASVLVYLCQIVFSICLTVGSVRSAQQLSEKIIR